MRNFFKIGVVLFFLSGNLFAQSQIITPLFNVKVTKDIPITSNPITFSNNIYQFKNLPNHFDKFWIGKIVLNREQYWYSEFQKKDSLSSYYKSQIENFKIDTLSLSKTELQSFVWVLSGIRNTKKIVIIDQNRNLDFSDDKEIEYDMEKLKKYTGRSILDHINEQSVSYQSLKKGEVINESIFLKIKPIDDAYKYKIKSDSIRALYVVPNEIKIAKFEVNGKKYKIGIFNRNFGFLKSQNFTFNIQDLDTTFSTYDWVIPKTKFKKGEFVFDLKTYSLDEESVSIAFEKVDTLNIGWQLNDFIPAIEVKNLDFDFKGLIKNKNITILDFWGTWCKPCIEVMPQFVQFKKSLDRSKFNVISVACEYDSNGLKNAEKYLQEFEYSVKELLKEKSSINSKLNVFEYPMIIAINNNGKIVFREIGKNALENLKLFLKI